MTYLPSLPDDAKLLDVFRAHPETARPLLALHEVLMRGPSPLTVAERELVAAYVSGLNACGYCYGVHRATAEQFGVDENLLEQLLADLDAAPVEDRLRAVLRYVGTLTREPSRLTPADARSVYEAGWDEQALHDAVAVAALFNLMNRMVEGLGVTAGSDYFPVSARRLADGGYTGLTELL